MKNEKVLRYLVSLNRKKTRKVESLEKSELKKALNVFDLTFLGVGSTLGVGVYVLAGTVAKNQAGPAIVISFLVAAIASILAGLCYAEFASRLPRAGSAYAYSYVTMGELTAFYMGWNLVLEYVIGTASVAKGSSEYFNSLFNKTIERTLMEAMPIHVPFLAPYPDFLAFSLVFIVGCVVAVGVKESTILHGIFTFFNLTIITIIIIAGSIYSDWHNWFIPKNKTDGNAGEGGFAPYGFDGIMAGAAKCFFAYVGFDSIASAGEEAKNPLRDLPISILLSLFIVFVAYFGISTVLTMMVPYYLQDESAPFPMAFDRVGVTSLKYVVTVGALCALFTSLLGSLFPLPRILYAMGSDGVIFKFLAVVNKRTLTPLLATIISVIFAGLLAMLMNLIELVDMMSIGTLMTYSIVAICVLILRYEEPQEQKLLPSNKGKGFFKKIFRRGFNTDRRSEATVETSLITKWGVLGVVINSFAIFLLIIFAGHEIRQKEPWAVALLTLFSLLLFLNVIIICRQPRSSYLPPFRVPLIPFLPVLSLLMNTYLMLQLDVYTWIRFGIWCIIGFIIYFGYGHGHSLEGKEVVKEEEAPAPKT